MLLSNAKMSLKHGQVIPHKKRTVFDRCMQFLKIQNTYKKIVTIFKSESSEFLKYT
jgi:hypothetical protein